MIDVVSAVLPGSCRVNKIQPNELLSENFEIGNPAIASPADLVMIDESVSDKPKVVLRLP